MYGCGCKVKSMDDNCGEWVECMGVASGCGCKMVYRLTHITYMYPYFLFIYNYGFTKWWLLKVYLQHNATYAHGFSLGI